MAARRRRRLRAALEPRALSLALFAMYAAIQIGLILPSWIEFVDEQTQHGQPARVFGPDGFVWMFLEQMSQNWQSEFLALALVVSLTAVLLHRGSKHSRDGNDEVQQRVQQIQRRVQALGEEAR